MSALLLGISLGANVVLLLTVLGLLLLGHTALFSPSGSSGPPSQGPSMGALAVNSPTATVSPTLVASAGWLQVAPSSVHLGCGNGQQNQFVVLQNMGPERVQWQVRLSLPGDQAGVQVSPTRGALDPGASTTVQIRNITGSSENQGTSTQQGVMLFEPSSADAGSPPNLSYTVDSC